MKISVITVVFNAAATLGDTLASVAQQSHDDIEHIVIDGGSDDGSLDLIRDANSVTKWISEPDDGLYHAMNKGLELASGDAIGFLNADDVFAHEKVLSNIAKVLSDQQLEACYANLVYVAENDLNHVVRNWQSQEYRLGLSWNGWMPAHPTFYIKKLAWQRIGQFDTSLKFQSDLEFCARAFEIHGLRARYVPDLWVRMRVGGVTNRSLKNIWAGNWESYKALRRLGLKRDPLTYFTIKFASRIKQYF